MAIYYFLALECGSIKNDSINLCNYFKGKNLNLSDGTQVQLLASTLMDEIGKWWVEVYPEGASYGSPMGSDYRLLDYFTGELTRGLYNLLKKAPSFRYAIAGHEVEFFVLYNELEGYIKEGAYEGFILSRELWLSFNKQKNFKYFSDGYVWYPYLKNSLAGQSYWFKKYLLKKEYRINEFLTLKLENDDSNIYVHNELINQCRHLLINKTKYDNSNDPKFNSIDELEDFFESSKYYDDISIETEFWGHCSNLQAWVENNYNTNLLDKTIAFPVLKKLAKVGDPIALKTFKNEVKNRIKSLYLPVIVYLINNGYLRTFTNEELTKIIDILKKYITNLPLKTKSQWNKQISEAFRNSIYIRSSTELRNDEIILKLCKIALEFDPLNNYAWYEMGLSYQFLKKNKNAEDCYIHAIEIDPRDNISIGNLCDIYITQGRFEETISILETTLNTYPNNSILWYLLGKVYFETDKFKKALHCVNKSIKQYPYNIKAKKLYDHILNKSENN